MPSNLADNVAMPRAVCGSNICSSVRVKKVKNLVNICAHATYVWVERSDFAGVCIGEGKGGGGLLTILQII